jgi:hypothetical protein
MERGDPMKRCVLAMKTASIIFVASMLLLVSVDVMASGPAAIYGIIERVVLEPNDASPERIQIWGTFSLVDVVASGFTKPQRGYLYFSLPNGEKESSVVKKEWADLKAIAGTGQAISFGYWECRRCDLYGPDSGLTPGGQSRLEVRVASEPPNAPAVYNTNAGIVKLPDQGSHADVVKQLREALKTR